MQQPSQDEQGRRQQQGQQGQQQHVVLVRPPEAMGLLGAGPALPWGGGMQATMIYQRHAVVVRRSLQLGCTVVQDKPVSLCLRWAGASLPPPPSPATAGAHAGTAAEPAQAVADTSMDALLGMARARNASELSASLQLCAPAQPPAYAARPAGSPCSCSRL